MGDRGPAERAASREGKAELVMMYLDVIMAKRKIAVQMQRMIGYPPVGLDDFLNILVGPDLLPLMKELIAAKDRENEEREADRD